MCDIKELEARFLDFLEKDIIAHPEHIKPADDLIAEMEALVGKVEGWVSN